ncbi:caspase family protein [Nocardia fluminea]|uniref:caspase family protein n=1 Tax=Nocardia fluminea TaxID=134984 RepID=UPI003D11E9C5
MSKSFILSIGVDRYESDSIGNLKWAVADATAFYERALKGREKSSLKSRLLINDDATTRTIRESLGEWLATASRADNVIIFFAGHGAREIPPLGEIGSTMETYLLSSDTQVDHLYSTGISLTNELPIILKRIPASNITLLFDCCLSGAARIPTGPERARGIDGPNLTKMKNLSDVPLNAAVVLPGGGTHDIGDGITTITASGPEQAAMESDELEHGVFTYSLLKAMRENSQPGSPSSPPLGRLYSETTRLVMNHTAGRQVPMLVGRLSDQRLFVGN